MSLAEAREPHQTLSAKEEKISMELETGTSDSGGAGPTRSRQ